MEEKRNITRDEAIRAAYVLNAYAEQDMANSVRTVNYICDDIREQCCLDYLRDAACALENNKPHLATLLKRAISILETEDVR